MIPITAAVYTQGFGTKPIFAAIISNRAPGLTDINYPVGQQWVNTVSNTAYVLTSFSSANNVVSATWTFLGAGSGDLNTITTDDATVVAPTAGTILFHGTSNQIVTTGSNGPGAITAALSSTLIAPGSLEVTSGFTVDAGTSSITGTTNINTSGSAVTTIGTGGTGAVAIGNATGNVAVTGKLTASTGLAATTGGLTVSAGGAAITGTTTINTSGASTTSIGTGGTGTTNIGNATGNTAVTGSLTASTGLVATTGGVTATAGNLVATAGNLNLNGAASKININVATSTSASAGFVTLAGAATTTLTSSSITANSIILFSLNTLGTVSSSAITYTTTGGSATITPASSTDTSVYGYLIIN